MKRKKIVTDEAERFLYQHLADEVGAAIRQGVFRPGEKLPSLRLFCHRHEVRLSTALQVHRSLEQTRLVESRPESGYGVLAPGGGEACEPAAHPYQLRRTLWRSRRRGEPALGQDRPATHALAV